MPQKDCIIFISFFLVCLSTALYSNTDKTFNNNNLLNAPPPSNDICSGAIVIFGDGILDCDDMGAPQIFNNDLTGTGDPEATGNCVSNTDPGVWYTFSTPPVMPYSALYIGNTPGLKAEVFSSASGCSGLVYVDCAFDSGAAVELEPSTQYYILLATWWMVGSMNSNIDITSQTECDDAWPIEESFALPINVCETPSSLVPCENEYVHWRTYTTGCNSANITIEVGPPIPSMLILPAEEISIVAVLDDCATLMSDYDPAGTGYVCSALGANQKLELQDIPPYTKILFGFGSGLDNMGSFKTTLTTSNPGFAVNDDFFDAINLSMGNNINLDNYCATQDNNIMDCAPGQSHSSVWYVFDEGVGPLDVTIELNSNGIVSPGLAVYGDGNGILMDQNCSGGPLELYCVELPFYIQVTSAVEDEGEFDLAITSAPSAPGLPAVVTSNDICNGSEVNIDIATPNGNLANISIAIAPGSSPSISGMTNQTINGSSSATINDVLINNSNTVQEAIYLISLSNTGLGCPPEPIEHSIFVFPSFSISPLSLEECLPHLLEIDVADVITGGSPPYSIISWYWNGVDPIGTGNALSYDLTESGTITVEVVDNEDCAALASIDVTTITPIIPTFDIQDEYCQSDQDYIAYPTTSLEGIEGTWNPSPIDVTQITTTEFINATFTPSADFCSETIIHTILVFTGLEPEFNLPSALCAEEDIYVFPDTDLNGFTGTWQTPSIDLSTISGVQYNTFVVSTPGCFLDFEYEYEVQSSISIEFDFPESICKNNPALTLNNTSLQGYEGTWDTSVIDPASTNDDFVTTTWSPLIGQSPCLSDTTITIAITDPIMPSFNLPDELCQLDSIFTFPTEDLQSVAGSWSIVTLDPSVIIGILVSEFTPDEACASAFTWEIEIAEPVVPVFNFDTLYCSLESSFVLPTESDNGIQGTWSMPVINPSDLAGQELTVQFSGSNVDECVNTFETVINIEEAQDLVFDLADQFCWTDDNILLPTTSLNGISGSWEPSIIDIQANIGQSITIEFTPEIGNCFRRYTQIIEVLAPYIVDANTADPSGCNVEDGSITMEVQQGQNLEFSIDNGDNWQNTNVFDALGSGSYTILVRSIDHVLCELSINAYLNSVDGPNINEVVSSNIDDCTTDNGIITIDAEGTNLEYSIDGMNWQTSNIFENLPEGNYEIEIRETLSDCIVSATAAIIDFPDTEITMINTNDVSDCNAADGSLEIIAEGLALEYSIDNGLTWSTSNIFTGLEADIYEIITQSTEGINCTSSSEAVLIEPSLPIILDIVIDSPTTCNPVKGSLLVIADGVAIEYSIDDGLTWQEAGMFSDLSADEYHVIIREKDNVNCYTETLVPIIIEFDQLEESILQPTPNSDCDLEDGSIEIVNSFINLEYSIDGGATWQQNTFFDNLPSGLYSIISRKLDFPDCRVEQSIEVPKSDCPCNELFISYSVSDITCEDEASGEIILTSAVGMIDDNIDILWQNGTSGQIVEVTEPGWHIVTIIYDDICTWTDSAYVDKLRPIQFELIKSEASCQNSSDGTIEVINVDGGSNSYMYSLDGENFQSENQFLDLESGNYDVYVIDDTDCLTIENTQIHSPSEIEISLPDIETIKQGESIVLDPEIDATQIDSFSWTIVNDIFNSADLVIEVSPTSTSTYVLEIFYGGCYDRKEITIEVKLEDTDIIIGNTFSPNGDGINDILYIQGILNSTVVLNQFSIYDRWGNVIFDILQPEINNAAHGWDGYSRGKLVITGVYIYQLNYTQNGQSVSKYGTVTVIN